MVRIITGIIDVKSQSDLMEIYEIVRGSGAALIRDLYSEPQSIEMDFVDTEAMTKVYEMGLIRPTDYSQLVEVDKLIISVE